MASCSSSNSVPCGLASSVKAPWTFSPACHALDATVFPAARWLRNGAPSKTDWQVAATAPVIVALLSSWQRQRQLRKTRRRASLQTGESAWAQQPGSAELSSIPGQRARYLLLENPALFEDDLERAFSALADQSGTQEKAAPTPSAEQDVDIAALRQRISEVRESDRGRAASELLYLMVCNEFRGLGAPLSNPVKVGGRAALGLTPLEGALTTSLHSPDVLAAVEEHLRESLPSGTPGFTGNASDANQLVQLPLFNIGQAYAMSILYGYVLRRAETRRQLERSLQSEALPSQVSLKGYVEGIIGPGAFQDGMVTVEAHVAAEMQVEAVFGDLQQLREELQDAIQSQAPQDTASALREAAAKGSLVSLLLTGAELRRLLLEAVAFGSLLFRSESKVLEMYDLTLTLRCRLDRFGVETDSEGNPKLPPP